MAIISSQSCAQYRELEKIFGKEYATKPASALDFHTMNQNVHMQESLEECEPLDISLDTLDPSPTADSWEGTTRDTSSAPSPTEWMPATSSAISPSSDPSRCVPNFYNISEAEGWGQGTCKISSGITALASKL